MTEPSTGSGKSWNYPLLTVEDAADCIGVSAKDLEGRWILGTGPETVADVSGSHWFPLVPLLQWAERERVGAAWVAGTGQRSGHTVPLRPR